MSDAPDWQKVVALTTSVGEVTDAPDWQRVVVAPGGEPVGGGGLSLVEYTYLEAGYVMTNSQLPFMYTGTFGAGFYLVTVSATLVLTTPGGGKAADVLIDCPPGFIQYGCSWLTVGTEGAVTGLGVPVTMTIGLKCTGTGNKVGLAAAIYSGVSGFVNGNGSWTPGPGPTIVVMG